LNIHRSAIYLLYALGLTLSAAVFAQPTPSGDSSSGDSTRHQVDAELRQLLIDTINQSDSFEDRYDAEVWLVSKREAMGRFVKDPKERMDLLRRIHRAASQAGLQPEIVLALIEVESHFNRFAISRVGAQGMMQVMPFWKNEIGRPEDNLTDIDTNLLYGCTILKHYLDRSNGRLMEALARYNGSYGQYWYPRRVMTAWEKHWR
jgi:soluble lytic murein transglycosylase-like protein